jgi:hypothetical protein
VLLGYKPVVHWLTRLVAATTASGLILALAVVMLAVAVVVFSGYLLVLFVLTALSFLVFVPIRLAHGLWLLQRRIAYRCPYDDHGVDAGLPVHICSCGRQYDDLQPSFYGIFYHTCRHSNGEVVKLPTMDWWGRNKLPRLCRGCKRPLVFSSIGELSDRPIAVVGGPSAGKTIFLRQATRQLRDRLGAWPGAKAHIESAEQADVLEQDLALLDQGQVLAKTSGDVSQAFGLAVRIPKRLHSLLYIYDAPGEVFLTMERFGRKQVVRYLGGVILLVDPFSLPALADYARRLGSELKPSETPFHDVVSVFINGINQTLMRQAGDKCDVPVAVVVGKADAFPTRDLPFLANLCSAGERSPDGALNARCRAALEQLGEGRSIRALEQKFSRVQYFACSALGRLPDRRNTAPFQPLGVTEPFLWLLGLDRQEKKLA